ALAQEERRDVGAVDLPVGRHRSAGQGDEGGEEVDVAGDGVAGGPGGDTAGPPGDGGHAHAPLVGAALAAAQRRGDAPLPALDEPGAVVAGEDDERVLGEVFGAQRVEHAADGVIDLLDPVAVGPVG